MVGGMGMGGHGGHGGGSHGHGMIHRQIPPEQRKKQAIRKAEKAMRKKRKRKVT